MSLERVDFVDFFATVHDGHRPFRWQQRLLDRVLDTGRWPGQLVAPTGAGKTSVIDVHVFAVALMASGHPVRVPRRLALVVDRRALVDDQHEYARSVADRLAKARGGDGVLGRMAEALTSLGGRSVLATPLLRGGARPSRDWLDDPVGCTVLCATPDMWGSRLLLSGYGSRAQARPREAGLLAFDTVAVVDEAHLSRQLVRTARRVAELAVIAHQPLGVPVLQVVETTATPPDDIGDAIGVEPDDLGVDGPLRQRLTAPKPVTLIPLASWPIPRTGPGRAAGIAALADEATRLRKEYGPTVGCFVNTVPVAAAVRAELKSRGLTTELVCGRLRPYDVARLKPPRSGLLSIAGDPTVDVLVATQSLEVGVDLDLSAAVTELAPGGAIAQRAGRVNRLGRRSAAVSVVVPATDLPTADRLVPYRRDDLAHAHTWLAERQSDPHGLAPWALREDRPPAPELERELLQRLELAEAWHLARTSDDLAAVQEDLDLWLSDDLDAEDHEFGLVVRHALPADAADAVRLIETLPPRNHEVFPVSLRLAGTIHARLKPGSILIRPGENSPRPLTDTDRLRPGDQLVVDDTTELFTAGVPTHDGTDRVSDVLDALDEPGPGDVVLRIEGDRYRGFLDAVAASAEDRETPDPDAVAALLREHQERLTPRPMVVAAISLLGGPPDKPIDAEPILHWAEDDDEPTLIRLIVVDLRTAATDAELRQVWTPRRRPVPLHQHADAVAERAATVATRLGLDPDLVEALRLGGLLHDEGKADERFQRSLRAGPTIGAPLAKSGVRDRRTIRRLRTASGLPTGWRHEQLSVVHAWAKLPELGPTIDRDLVLRLVGTSHGNGRHTFPHTAEQLTDGADRIAADLFDEGGWDELIEHTHIRWGVWGCAYLEALLRAADGQISAEGS